VTTLAEWAYTELLGYPLVFWLGIATYALVAATFGVMRFGRRPWKFRWHKGLGRTALLVATAHGLLALAAYLA